MYKNVFFIEFPENENGCHGNQYSKNCSRMTEVHPADFEPGHSGLLRSVIK